MIQNQEGHGHGHGHSDGHAHRTTIVHIDADLQDLIPDFLERRYLDIQSLADALAAKDSETIKSIAHKMKGTSGMYGFDQISEIGREIQEARLDGNFDEIKRLIRRFELYLNSITVVYDHR